MNMGMDRAGQNLAFDIAPKADIITGRLRSLDWFDGGDGCIGVRMIGPSVRRLRAGGHVGVCLEVARRSSFERPRADSGLFCEWVCAGLCKAGQGQRWIRW